MDRLTWLEVLHKNHHTVLWRVLIDGLSSLPFVSFALFVLEQLVTFALLQELFWIFRTHCPRIC